MDHWSWHHRANNAIAQGYLTNSKRPESFVKGVYPTHVLRGEGGYLYDTSGRKYLDLICGLGTQLIGYGNPRIGAAISEQYGLGVTHSLATTLEVLVAEKLKEFFPFVDAFKFLKGGGQACDAAIRIARAHTGRDVVLSSGYHGCGDDFVSLTPPALGVPARAHIRPFRSCDDISGETAAVIIEPVVTDFSRDRIEDLKRIREACTKNGCLLIFDEVITGLRFERWSVANKTGILPDLIVLGKALGGGLPLSAVGGSYAVMSASEYFISTTHGGETLSLAAANALLKLLQNKVFDIDRLWEEGKIFQDAFNAAALGVVELVGYPTRGIVKADPAAKAAFMQECCDAGILVGSSWFLSFPNIAELPKLLSVFKAMIGRIKRGEVKLRGEAPKSPFAEAVRARPSL